MLVCQECNSHLADGSVYCSECGAAVSASETRTELSPADIESRLAAANLHRLRGQYAEATDECTSILKLAPESPDVHCLLGDVYADQNNVEEAMRWYQMAAEIDPESKACADKLEELARKLADINAARGRTSWFDRFVIGENFESSIRIITFTSAGFAALLIAFGLAALFSQKTPHRGGGVSGPLEQVDRAPVNRKPLVVPPTSAGAGNSSQVRTAYEEHLLYQITSAEPVQTGHIAVTGARLDPRTQALTITFRNASNSLDRSETILNAGALARAGFSLSEDIALVILRCLAVVPDSSGHDGMTLVFIGDIPRQSLASLEANAPPEQIQAVLQQPWWASVVP